MYVHVCTYSWVKNFQSLRWHVVRWSENYSNQPHVKTSWSGCLYVLEKLFLWKDGMYFVCGQEFCQFPLKRKRPSWDIVSKYGNSNSKIWLLWCFSSNMDWILMISRWNLATWCVLSHQLWGNLPQELPEFAEKLTFWTATSQTFSGTTQNRSLKQKQRGNMFCRSSNTFPNHSIEY